MHPWQRASFHAQLLLLPEALGEVRPAAPNPLKALLLLLLMLLLLLLQRTAPAWSVAPT